jgi:hypothetical protein
MDVSSLLPQAAQIRSVQFQWAQPWRSRGLQQYEDALRVKLEASSLAQPRAGCVEIGLLGAEQWSFAWSGESRLKSLAAVTGGYSVCRPA